MFSILMMVAAVSADPGSQPVTDVPAARQAAWTKCRNEKGQLSAPIEMEGCDELIAAQDVDNEIKAIAHANRGMLMMPTLFRKTARDEFDRAIVLNPKLGPAYYNRGLLSALEGKLDEAIADYTRAVTAWPQISEAYVNRAIAYAESGKTELALQDFTKVIEIEPANAENYENRAALYHQLGREPEARADLAKAKSLGK